MAELLMDTPLVRSGVAFKGKHLRTHCRENAIHETAKNSFQNEVTMRTHRNCIFIVAVAAVLLSSSLSIGASVEVTGDFKLNGAGNGVVFPDGSVQTTAAAPAWHQILPAAQRFVILADFFNEAVLDKETGLVWEQSPETSLHSWQDAQDYCFGRYHGDRGGWGLPRLEELSSLLAFLPAGHPFTNVQSGSNYWSATTRAEDTTQAWTQKATSTIKGWHGKTETNLVWCVRGGRGYDGR
jgi:hypothetical protein